MKTMWKYELNAAETAQDVQMPRDAWPAHVELVGGKLYVWVMVNPDLPLRMHTFYIFGTGQPIISDTADYVGTFRTGEFVWHVFKEYR